MQALIGNYAVPILDKKQVWGTSDDTKTAYLDSMVSVQHYLKSSQQILRAHVACNPLSTCPDNTSFLNLIRWLRLQFCP